MDKYEAISAFGEAKQEYTDEKHFIICVCVCVSRLPDISISTSENHVCAHYMFPLTDLLCH